MFNKLRNIDSRPTPFEFYTADALWTDDHTSQQMLAHHLDDSTDLSSRNSAFIDRSAAWIIRRYGLGAGKKVVDFGCGPGLYTHRLAKTGASITGIDFSRRSIEYAREMAERETLSIRYIHQNYLEFDTSERFDLILMIYCDFCALSPTQRKLMLAKFSHLLNSGGAVILDAYSLQAFDRRQESSIFEHNLLNGFWSAREYYGFLHVFKYPDQKVVLDKYTIVEADRSRTIYNWLQYFSREQIEREFLECGLKITEFFGDAAGAVYSADSVEFAIEAQKA
jgi:cyclopropane fatty-acyl-phospholipid synthase-like methyltransferase